MATARKHLMISDGAARKVAADHHGGQTSLAYSFASSGAISDVDGLIADLHEDLTEEQKNAPEMVALTDYIRATGTREAVPGWSERWDDNVEPRDWHMLDQLPAPGYVPGNLDPQTKVYALYTDPEPVDEETGGPLEGDRAQYRLYEVGERAADGTIRYHDTEIDTEWSYTSREGSQHEEIQHEVTEWAGQLFGRPIDVRDNGCSDWDLGLPDGPADPGATSAGTDPAPPPDNNGGGSPASAPRGEVTGLGSAITYAQQLAAFCTQTHEVVSTMLPSGEDTAGSCAQSRRHLEKGGVTGPALTDIVTVQDQVTSAVAGLHSSLSQLEAAGAAAANLQATLERHRQTVGAAYQSNPDAGGKAFVTAP
jgi:hypothetical protein